MKEESIEETAIATLDLTFHPEIFDPNKDQLRAIAEQVALIEADPEKMTKETLELINATKNNLVKARTRIQKIGKAQRDPANAYAKEVKAYEDSLLDILAPEEARMKDLEASAKAYAMKQERLKTLPDFKAKLESIGDPGMFDFENGSAVTDDFLLSLDPNQRDQFYNERLSAKNELDRAAIAEEKRQAEEEKAIELQSLITARREIMFEIGFVRSNNGLQLATIETPIELSDEQIHAMSESQFATESSTWRKLADSKKAGDLQKAQEEAKRQAEEEAKKAAAAQEAQRQAEAKAAEEKAKQEAEAKQKEEEARRSSEAYQQWLSENSYNESTDKVEQNDGVYTLYRVIATYQPGDNV